MAEQWLIERNGQTWGPFSLEHLQGLISSGELRPDEMVLPEGGRKKIAAYAVPGLAVPPPPPPQAEAPLEGLARWPGRPSSNGAPRRRGFHNKWLWAGAGVALVFLGLVWWSRSPAERSHQEFPNLPEWFQPPCRVRHVDYPVPKGWVNVEGVGWVRPDAVPPPGNFTEEWLEKHFTHYIYELNAFYWAWPKAVFVSDGKLMAGTKVIFGEEVNGLVLICTRTRDGRVANMFVEPSNLRERSKGPPPVRDE